MPSNWQEITQNEDNDYISLQEVDIGDKLNDLRRARELSTELTQKGAVLYDLLLKEIHNKEVRITQSNRSTELSVVDSSLRNAIRSAQLKLQNNRAQLENARRELNALNLKLQRRKAELERNKQRLEALQKIRPAHMEEFEQCEKELQILFQQYFLRFHVRDALKIQLETRTKKNIIIKTPVNQKLAEDGMTFLPESLLLDDDDEENDCDSARLDVSLTLEPNSLNIRYEDFDLQTHQSTMNKRPGSAISRARSETFRQNRLRDTATTRRPVHSQLNSDNEQNQKNSISSFSSTDSNLDIAGIIDIESVNDEPVLGANVSNIIDTVTDNDDDFDLNSMESISISKITGDLPLHPKNRKAKSKQQSDEDF